MKIAKTRRNVRRFAAGWLLGSIYVLGLTSLYPYFLLGIPNPAVLLIPLLLTFVGVVGTYRQQRTISRTLQRLGRITLIPGSVGVLLLVFGRATLEAFLPDGVTPFVETYIAFAVPAAATLTVIYFVLGAALYYLGRKLR